MDIVPYVAQAQTFLSNNPLAVLAIGAASGAAVNNAPAIALFGFNGAMKFPWFRSAIVANPEKAKATGKAMLDAIDAAIDDAAQHRSAPASAPTLAAAPDPAPAVPPVAKPNPAAQNVIPFP